MSSVSLSFLLHNPNHSPGKPKYAKPRIRAEPGEPQAQISDFLQAFPLLHGLLAANDNCVSIVDDSVADRVCQNRIDELLSPARNVKFGIQDRRSSLVPGLHNLQKFAGIRFFQGQRSHSSIIRSEYFLYWARRFQMLPLPLAMLNSTSRSGRWMYMTVRNCLTAAIPSAHAR